MHAVGPGQFEKLVAELISHRLGRGVAGFAAETRRGIDVTFPSIRTVQNRTVVHLATGSGKSLSVAKLARARSFYTGESSASARQLVRSGLSVETLQMLTVSPVAQSGGDRGHQLTVIDGKQRLSMVVPRMDDGRTRLAWSVRADALELAADRASITRLADRLAANVAMSRWLSDRIQDAYLEAFIVSTKLALDTKSRLRCSSGPPPTAPPGELVRTHPRVPRGPGSTVSDLSHFSSAA